MGFLSDMNNYSFIVSREYLDAHHAFRCLHSVTIGQNDSMHYAKWNVFWVCGFMS